LVLELTLTVLKAHEDTEGNMKRRSGNDLCTAVKHFSLFKGTASPSQAEAKLSSDHGSSGRCAAEGLESLWVKGGYTPKKNNPTQNYQLPSIPDSPSSLFKYVWPGSE